MRRFKRKKEVQLASSVESQAKTTGGGRLMARHVADVKTCGRVEGLVFISGLLQV